MDGEQGKERANPELPQGFAVLAALFGNSMCEGVSIGVFFNSLASVISRNPKLIRDLISIGKFTATKHSIHAMNATRGQPHHECDDCYSGDTEFEHDEELRQLSKSLGKAYKMSSLKFTEPEDGDSSDASDDGDD